VRWWCLDEELGRAQVEAELACAGVAARCWRRRAEGDGSEGRRLVEASRSVMEPGGSGARERHRGSGRRGWSRSVAGAGEFLAGSERERGGGLRVGSWQGASREERGGKQRWRRAEARGQSWGGWWASRCGRVRGAGAERGRRA
jgi:hypothetical protein